jgi:hypothetical protein
MKSIAAIAAACVLLAPGVSLAQKGAAKPDFTLDPNYGSVRLETGFTPDPWIGPNLGRAFGLRGQGQRRAGPAAGL